MAVYFAQATGNIDALNMWKDGSNNYLTWGNLAAGDTLNANAKTVTVNANIPFGTLTTANNGVFSIASGGITLGSTGNKVTIVNSYYACISCTHSSGIVAIYGDIAGGSNDSVYTLTNGSSGTLNIIGNVTGGSALGYAAYNSASGTINVYGNVSGLSGDGHGMFNSSTGTINVYGDVTGGTINSIYGIQNGGGTVTATNIIAGSATSAFAVYGNVTVTGNVINNQYTCATVYRLLCEPASYTSYIQYAKTSGTVKLPLQLPANLIKNGIASGEVTGNLKSGGGNIIGSSVIRTNNVL